MTLLSIDRSAAALLPRPALPGAFDWWYADGRDAEGNGLVFICASRLPFFPEDEPSLNLALYRRGEPALWLLEQHPRTALLAQPCDGGFQLTLGRSVVRVTSGAGCARLDAQLDLAVPGDKRRLTGTLRVEGPSLLTDAPAQTAQPHRWVPVAPVAQVQARLSGAATFSLDALGYLDRNLGDAPLDKLSLRRWHWGRARRGDEALIWYALEGTDKSREGHLLRVSGGRAELTTTPWVEEGGVLFLDGLVIDPGRAVERSPFYRRSFGTVGGMPFISERCEVARIGSYAPLVRMKLHRPAAWNSIWAPLFCGPREGRFARLLRLGGRS